MQHSRTMSLLLEGHSKRKEASKQTNRNKQTLYLTDEKLISVMPT